MTARVMLLSILDTFRIKFEELNRAFPQPKDEDAMDEDSELDMRQVAERRPIKTSTASGLSETPTDHLRGLFHNCFWLTVRREISFQKFGQRVQNSTFRSS